MSKPKTVFNGILSGCCASNISQMNTEADHIRYAFVRVFKTKKDAEAFKKPEKDSIVELAGLFWVYRSTHSYNQESYPKEWKRHCSKQAEDGRGVHELHAGDKVGSPYWGFQSGCKVKKVFEDGNVSIENTYGSEVIPNISPKMFWRE